MYLSQKGVIRSLVTAASTAAALAFAVPAHADTPARSSVLDLTLPDGSFTLFHTDNSANYKHEVWRSSSTSVSTAAAALRPQLPVGAALSGIPWCAESHRSILGQRVAMFWYSAANDQPAIAVEVEKDDTVTGMVYVDISKWVDSHDACGDTRWLELS